MIPFLTYLTLAAPTSTTPNVPDSWLSSPAVVWLLGLAALATAIGILWKPVRALGRGVRAIQKFVTDWNGTPDEYDNSGAIKEYGTPGVPAMLEKVRSQVENSHHTNLRDDVDELRGTVDEIGSKLDSHIVIAIESDRRQDETAAKVERLYSKWADSPE